MTPGVTRIRFHGRGGQGMKTASRVVGTAATLDGHNAQDSPVYGAERRGAPMSAYTRIADGPIFERGFIPSPDIAVVADDTLFDDPTARPLTGLGPAGVLVISTTHPVDAVRRRTGHAGPIVACDFLALALGTGAGAISVSTALAAAVARVIGLSERAVADAIRTELGAHVSATGIEASLTLAARVREIVTVVGSAIRSTDAPVAADVRLVDVAYVSPEIGTASITARANTPLRRTGSWRLFRPVIELKKCTRCWVCFVRCPDGAIALDADDTPRVDDDVCKGCLICVDECPTGAITSTRELRPWRDTELVT
jgi:pyruvate ferredoxin oxidoreductase gamma subunit